MDTLPSIESGEQIRPPQPRKSTAARVAHFTTVHGPLDGRIFYRECRSLARAGYDVVIVAPGEGDATVDGVRIKTVAKPKNRFTRMFLTAAAVFRAALREDCAVYHFHDPELMPWGLWLRLLGKKVVYDAHEDFPKDIALKRWIPRLLRPPVAFATKHISRLTSQMLNATVVAVPSIAAGIAGRRTTIIYNYPVLDDIVKTSPRPWRERSRAAVYSGSITAIRGLREMMMAMWVDDMPPDAVLTLVGRFDDPALLETARRGSNWQRIDFVGWKEGAALWNLIGDAKVGVVTLHPTRTFVDSMPTKLFDYMALGLPVVASDFPAWREIVQSCRCGILVDPLDPNAIGRAIATLLRNPAEAEAMGGRGRDAIVSRYQWSAEARKLVALYDDLCAAK